MCDPEVIQDKKQDNDLKIQVVQNCKLELIIVM